MTCSHCGNPSNGARFCCPACETVYEAIHAAGLEAWYERRDVESIQPPAAPSNSHWLNRPEVAARFVHDGRAVLVLDGLHCAACCWLIENALQQIPGVTDARVNFSASRLHVAWDETLGLGDIVNHVARIGYKATPITGGGHDTDLLKRMAVAGFCAGNVMMLAAALYAGYFSGIDSGMRTFFHWLSWLLATPVMFYSAVPFLRGAHTALRHGTVTIDVPISIGVTATYLYSIWATVTHQSEVYFDTVAMFIFVLLIGRMVELGARRHATSALERLLALPPRTAFRVSNGVRQEVAVEELMPGDAVEVRAGEKFPVDGDVVSGWTSTDESMVTGESRPHPAGPGDAVIGATMNLEGTVTVVARRTGNDTVLSQIARLVESAATRRAPLQRVVDRVAARFIVVVLGLAAATFILWMPSSFERALMVTASVLIITCPCALGLATPVAVAVAGGRAAARGILFRGGDVLEALHRVTCVVVDKTGTLTEGRLDVRRVITAPGLAAEDALRHAAALEQHAVHPLARAIERAAGVFAGAPGVVFAGRGVMGDRWTVGSPSWMEELGYTVDPDVADGVGSEVNTVVYLACDGVVQAAITLEDRVRSEAPEVIQRLKGRGLRIVLCSGDRDEAVGDVARALGIDEWHSVMRPDSKAALVAALQAEGHHVAVIGDGVNDAPALTAAHVGIAVASSADLSSAAADVVLLRAGLRPVFEAFVLASDTFRTIQDNITISVMYNSLAIPSAMLGFVAPVAAAVAMPLSSLLVVGNSLRRRTHGDTLSAHSARPAHVVDQPGAVLLGRG